MHMCIECNRKCYLNTLGPSCERCGLFLTLSKLGHAPGPCQVWRQVRQNGKRQFRLSHMTTGEAGSSDRVRCWQRGQKTIPGSESSSTFSRSTRYLRPPWCGHFKTFTMPVPCACNGWCVFVSVCNDGWYTWSGNLWEVFLWARHQGE